MDKPIHPQYGPALGGAPTTIDGVTFWPFRVGVLRYTRCNAEGTIEVRRQVFPARTYSAIVNGKWLPKNFRKFHTAAQAAIKAL